MKVISKAALQQLVMFSVRADLNRRGTEQLRRQAMAFARDKFGDSALIDDLACQLVDVESVDVADVASQLTLAAMECES